MPVIPKIMPGILGTSLGIPPELIINWDQTGIRLVPSSSSTMVLINDGTKRNKKVEVVGQNDKHLITAIFCGSIQGDFLPIQLIYKGKLCVATHVMSFHLGGISHLIIGQWK